MRGRVRRPHAPAIQGFVNHSDRSADGGWHGSISVVAGAGKPEKALAVLGMFGGMGLAAFAANVVRLPSWARERARQMEAIAEHAVKLLSKP